MELVRAIISNFRGINGSIEIKLKDFNCIVGQNDSGKSTILRALDAFINDSSISRADFNVNSPDNFIAVELFFNCKNKALTLGEEIETTVESEELVNADNILQIKKTWTVTDSNIGKPKTSIVRKKYNGADDFIFKTEAQLIAHCTSKHIATTKGNGEEFNNVEKREKLRDHNAQQGVAFTFEYEEIPGTGTTKQKVIADAIKKALPAFQYFKADTSLSETDSTIQKYFKDIAFKLIEGLDTAEIEDVIKTTLDGVLHRVTDKINDVVKSDEKVEPKIDFDWSKLVSTSFISTSNGNDIPLSSRGDGFRRITMMSYFEYLAETQRDFEAQPIIFGFEEPETFLHPSAQTNLYDKLHSLAENGFQVIISTHSPTLVGNTQKDKLTHISKQENVYTVDQENIDYKQIAIDLGIKPDNTFTPLFSTAQVLFLVEGIDDVTAMHHLAEQYKSNGLIDASFTDLNIAIIPIGGCGGIKHWVNLDLFTKLEKPFFIFLDSDKSSAAEESKNRTELIEYGLTESTDFMITKKRLLENYMHPMALVRLVPGAAGITFGDFDHAKNICKAFPDSGVRGQLGGGNVVQRHFPSLTFDELRMTWFDGTDDEFLILHSAVVKKLN